MNHEKEKIDWMYEGVKSDVNREDYLLGKKVDKNFEKYSDVVNKEQPEALHAFVQKRTITSAADISTGLKTSSLQKDIIKSEDPLVAVKVREETKRREVIDNPLMKIKLQKLLKTMMNQKKEKHKKKKKRRSRSSSSSSESEKKRKKRSRSSSSSSENEKKQKKRSRTSSKQKQINQSPGKTSRRSLNSKLSRSSFEKKEKSYVAREESPNTSRNSEEKRKRRNLSRSPQRRSSWKYDDHRSTSRKQRNEQRSEKKQKSKSPEKRKRKTSSSSSSCDEWKEKSPATSSKKIKSFDSHIPENLIRNNDEREDESEKKETKFKNLYGLIEIRKKSDEEKLEESKNTQKKYEFVKIPNGRNTGKEKTQKKESRRQLTEEEKKRRLKEMEENVKWKEAERDLNIKKGKEEDKKEKEEAEKHGYAPSFIRNQIKHACDDLTMEKRLQSNKKEIQKSYGYMERNFARK